MEEPLRQIVENAGIEGSIVVQKVKEGKGDYGFNARTEVYENLFKAGVIDPTKVTRIALENAASIAGMLLTTECVVADKPKKEDPVGVGGGLGGGGGVGGFKENLPFGVWVWGPLSGGGGFFFLNFFFFSPPLLWGPPFRRPPFYFSYFFSLLSTNLSHSFITFCNAFLLI